MLRMTKIMKVKKSHLMLMIALSVYCIFIAAINLPQKNQHETAASQVVFEKAHILKVIKEDAKPDYWTEGLRLGTQVLYLAVDSGSYKGAELQAMNYLSAYGNVDLKSGSRIIVRLDKNENGQVCVASIVNYQRAPMIIGLSLAFVIVLCVIGGKKGIGALMGLIFTFFNIWFMLIPLVRRGIPAIPTTLMLIVITTFISMIFLNGVSKKALVASFGCICGVLFAGAIAYIAGTVTPLTGFNMHEAEDLILRAGDEGLKISGLLVCGILISSLGAVMDIAITITSAIEELYLHNKNHKRQELFNSAMNIGKDAMGTMANTLILAFAGASLNMLILFRVFDYPMIQIFNSDLMALEIVQGLAGAIGIVLTVPIVAGLGSYMYTTRQNNILVLKREG